MLTCRLVGRPTPDLADHEARHLAAELEDVPELLCHVVTRGRPEHLQRYQVEQFTHYRTAAELHRDERLHIDLIHAALKTRLVSFL